MGGEIAITFLIGWAGVALLLALTFFIARWLDNYGIVDAVWAAQFFPLTAWYVVAFDGGTARQVILYLMAAFWSLRLGGHLAVRIASSHPQEDWRYRELRDEWQGRFPRRMFGFFQVQGVFTMLLSLPLLLAAANPSTGFGLWEAIGLGLFGIGVAGEAVADWQLRAFKRSRSNRADVCQDGLWRYSRHPNYFFEWMIWVGFAVYALGSPWGPIGLIAPATMLWLLLKVTGIPPTEEQAVRAKGDAYRAYQRTTSSFFPWFPKSDQNPEDL